MNEYPDWLLELVSAITEFEDTHPVLYRGGDYIHYEKPVQGTGVPRFERVVGHLVGEKWCLDDISAHIPDPLRIAAYWFKRGKEHERAQSAEA